MSEVRVEVPYQKRHSRLKVLLRPILALPIIVAMLLMIVPNFSFNHARALDSAPVETAGYYDLAEAVVAAYNYADANVSFEGIGGQITEKAVYSIAFVLTVYVLAIPLVAFTLWAMYVINFAVALTLLFRKKYPNWWFAWNQSVQAFVLRIYCYSLFLTDKYPSLEAEDSAIQLHLPNPKAEKLNRFMPLIKWLLVVPYMAIYLVFLAISMMLVPLTFLLILITGKLPRWIHHYHVAVIKFYMRIVSYAVLLVTDKYPKIIFRG